MNIIGTPLFQWETGRQLQITPLQNMTVSAVHFSNPGDLEALVVKPKEVDGKIVADIPNILLQKGSNIVAYSVNVSSDCVETLRDYIFPVRKRAKPSDYVYTETEVLSYSYLDKRLDNLEGEGLSNAVSDYLKENPVQAGATKEEAEQIAQNKNDIADLKKVKLNASELPTAVNEALAQAKASGEFDGEPGQPGKDGADGKDGVVAVTGATVGQTVKISAVDENGVPTAWEAVEFPNGDLELIETVEFTEAIALLRDKLPAVKRLYIAFTMPETSTIYETYRYINVLLYRGNTRNIVYIPIEDKAAKRVGFLDAEVVGNQAKVLMSSSINSASHIPIQLSTVCDVYQNPENVFTKLHINSIVPAGTTIEIWGVRA